MRSPLHSPRLRRKKRQERIKKTSFFAALLLVFAVGGAYALSLPFFVLTGISVVGDSALHRYAVSAFVEKELSGEYLGFIPKANRFLYPRGRIVKNLLSEFPLLAAAEVGSRAAELEVALTDRNPAALWCSGEGCFFMDKSGFLFSAVPPDFVGLFYRFESGEEGAPAPRIGEYALSEERLRILLALFNRLDALALIPRTARLLAQNELVVTLQNGVRLLFVDDGDFTPAIVRFETLLSEKDLIPRSGEDGLNIEYIDLRHGNKIYFKPR